MIKKLNSSIPSNSVKLIDLYNKIFSGGLVLGPDFQRKSSVWKKQHKYAFIETILLNFPFPEIYIASGEVDLENLRTREVVVDGQQRLSTIVDYIQGKGDFTSQNKVIDFDDLSIDEKKEFLNYSITVKDLKDIGDTNTIEVFKRINSTNYSLNSNEILNAEYGGGEFAIFCKQLVEEDYNPSKNETDVIIDLQIRNLIVSFFKRNKVLSENDIKRMFDAQYIMLIVCTFLEGKYFGRSTRINHYLEKYNVVFDDYMVQIDLLKNSIEIIEKLKLADGSYWFNKANLFTLLVELKDVEIETLDLETLEISLLDLENKFDFYFKGNEEDISKLTQDEIKYFEVSRQGSHELAARIHRGKVIKEIITKSIYPFDQANNIVILKENSVNENTTHTTIIPTETGLNKGIMDATTKVREYLKVNNIHDYDLQQLGSEHKKILIGKFIFPNNEKDTSISLYRSNGRGDYRIWFSGLTEFAHANEKLAIKVVEGTVKIYNIDRYNYSEIETVKS